MTSASLLRSGLDQGQAHIASEFLQSTDGVRACLSSTALMDSTLQSAFEQLPAETRDHVAVLALGGYGRSELFPHSDVDVMLLIDGGEHQTSAGNAATAFLHFLWDAGLNVGHSVRTLQDAIAVHGQTLDSWVAMLESRYLCGDVTLANQFSLALQQRIGMKGDMWLPTLLFEETAARLTRFGNSVKLLEPNVKKSAGGLRDLHTAFWLYRGIEQEMFTPMEPGSPAILVFLNRLKEQNVLDEDVHAGAIEALRFLFRVRTVMHLQRKGPHDTLEYTLQREVAELLGYRQQSEMRSVEIFMRDYYLHARRVHSLYLQLAQRFRGMIEPSRRLWNRGRRIGSNYRLRDGMIIFDRPKHMLDSAEAIFEAFALAAEYEAELEIGVRTAIERSGDLVTPEAAASQECIAVMRQIFLSRRVAATLHDMNDLNIFGRIIPEFGDLVAFFQHNVYHYYTADEHTLIALSHVEELRDQQSFLHEVHRNLRRRDLLYWAVLLHDIAKPRGVADHEITGVPIAREIVRRLGFGDLADDVAFLVRNHLVMEQIAFRRNINDAETLKEFASRFEKPYQIDYLYLLTYADLSAVNPGVWTEWKATMLRELFQRTSEVLHRNLKGEQVDLYQETKREAAEEQIVEMLQKEVGADDVRRHLREIPNAAYTAVFTPEEIAQHIRLSATLGPVETLTVLNGSSSDVTVIAPDAPFALSRFCAVLAANDATIFSADIFTRNDGVIIDRFRVSDAATGGELSSRVCTKIAEDMRKVVAGELDVDRLFEEHHRKWKRRPKQPSNPNVKTDVLFEDTTRYTIIDVYAPDRVGFLYRVTETISRLELNIYFAKIATRVDGIVDAFYVLDRMGQPVSDPVKREEIRKAILETIQLMAERELTGA
jgi:[protein-PII] uridylyltransferase